MYTHHSPVLAPRRRSIPDRSPPPCYTSLPRRDTYSPYPRSHTPVYRRGSSREPMAQRVRGASGHPGLPGLPGLPGRVQELRVRTSSMRSTGSEDEDEDEVGDERQTESGSDSEDECTGRYIYASRGEKTHTERDVTTPRRLDAENGTPGDRWMQDKLDRIAHAKKDGTAWRLAIDARATTVVQTPHAPIHAALTSLLAYRPYAPPTQSWLARLARAVGAPLPDRSEGLVDVWGNPTSEWVLVWLDVVLALCVPVARVVGIDCGGEAQGESVLLEIIPHAHDHLLRALWVALIYIDLAYKNEPCGEEASVLREKIVREWERRRYWGGYARRVGGWGGGGGDGWSRKVRAVEEMGERRTLGRVWAVLMDFGSNGGDRDVEEHRVIASDRAQRDHAGPFQEIQKKTVKREGYDDRCISDQSAQAASYAYAHNNHANAERRKMRRSSAGVRIAAGLWVKDCSAGEAEKADECRVKLEREESVGLKSVDSADRLGAKLSVTPELEEVKCEPEW